MDITTKTQSPMRNALQIGRVIDVDPHNYTIDVALFNSEPQRIQCVSSYFDTRTGSGFVYVPAKDSMCVVTKLENGDYAILGFIAAPGQGLGSNDEPYEDEVGFRSNRPLWDKGDFGMVGPLDNFIKVETSGALQLRASDMCQMYFLPDTINMIKAVSDNMEFLVGNSHLSIKNDRMSKSGNFELKIQSVPDSTSGEVTIQIGKRPGLIKVLIDGATILSIDSNKKVTINNNLIVKA